MSRDLKNNITAEGASAASAASPACALGWKVVFRYCRIAAWIQRVALGLHDESWPRDTAVPQKMSPKSGIRIKLSSAERKQELRTECVVARCPHEATY